MITLHADRPAPSIREVDLFGGFAGLWRTHVTVHPSDGSPSRHAEGEWEFGYALEGRAVIDVWQVPGRDGLGAAGRTAKQECGLCVRVWDPRLQLWRFTFHGTARGEVVHMFARRVGEEIVMESAEGGELVRWIFSDVRDDVFAWRSERSRDGVTWRREQEVLARRVGTFDRPAPRDDLAGVLHAAGPHPSFGEQARVFDRFAGSWACDYTHFAGGEVTERYTGRVVFGWIADGHAVQDVWIGDPFGGAGERSIGTSIRFFDPASGLWTVVWFAPQAAVMTTVVGGQVGERIVLEGKNADGSLRRWSFNDISADSFTWRGERSTDLGATWEVTAEYLMKREADPSVT